MAFTVPRDWTTSELVTESIMDVHIRDNFLAMGPHLLARKASDEAIANTTLQDDNDLLVNIPANEIWQLKWCLLVVGSASTADFVARFTFPSGGRVAFFGVGVSIGVAIATKDFKGTTSPTPSQDFDIGTTDEQAILIEGVYKNGGTGGNVVLQWAANGAGTTTVKANSTLWGVKLA